MPKATRTKQPFRLSAANADKHTLYQIAVQCPEAEIDFVTSQFKRLRGRPLRKLREDFCGTAFSSCEFVSRHAENHAVGFDLDAATLRWGMHHNAAKLTDEARARLTLLKRDVRATGREGQGVDAVNAMNFSYWIFQSRPALRDYFAGVRSSLAKDGILFMDAYGGSEASKVMQERRRCSYRGNVFKYVWDQAAFDPITSQMRCHIHFEFSRGKPLHRAFTYEWRLWTLPEIRELLLEAGFRKTIVYWEGDDGKGGGNGVFRPAEKGEDCRSFICYVVALK